MKVAFIRKKYSDFGGAELYIRRLAERLAESGNEVHLFANSWKIKSEAKGIIFHKIPILKGLSLFSLLSFLLFLKIKLKKNEFDIVHSFEKTLSQDIYRAGDGCHREWLLQRSRYRSFLKNLIIRINPFHICMLYIEKKIFKERNYKFIIANSKMVKENIMKHYNVPEKKIRIIYNSIDTEKFNPDHIERFRKEVREKYGVGYNDILISFIGSGFERKGLGYAIRAVKELRDKKYKLIIVGKGNPKRYKRLADHLSIKKKIVFAGPMLDTYPIYGASDVFLLPTIYDPFSNACLEAIATGIPVLTTRMNGAFETVVQGKNGFVIEDPRNTKEIAEKINLSVQLDREELSRTNRDILERFSKQRDVRETISLYKEVLNEPCH
ncbi:MAG TPA: glycosyltransferase family 4 protein [Nitrospinota bacterium]|nr:glycosyltransferase family 4 protein [Nitrospinota bacterium]